MKTKSVFKKVGSHLGRVENAKKVGSHLGRVENAKKVGSHLGRGSARQFPLPFQGRGICAPKRLAASLLAASALIASSASAASLLESYQQALEYDKKLKTAEYQSKIASARRLQTVANLLPSFSFNASVNVDKYTRFGRKMDESYKSYGVSMRQQIFKPALWMAAKAEHKRERAAEFAYKSAQNELALRLSEAYFAYQFSAAAAKLAAAYADANDARLKQISKSFKQGLVSKMDFLEAKIRADKSALELSKAQRDETNARIALENITGTSAGEAAEFSKLDLDYFAALDTEKFSDISQNYEYQQQLLAVQIAADEVQAKQADFLPSVDFSASVNDNRYQHPREFGDKRNEFNARLSLSMPLFTSGFLNGRLQEARYAKLAATSQKQAAEAELKLRQKRALSEFSAALRQCEVAGEALEHAQLYEAAAQRSYELGLKDIVELSDARARAYEARSEAIKSASALISAYLQLEALSGNISEGVMSALSAAMK